MQPWGRLPDCLAEAELDSSSQRSPGGQRAVVSPSLEGCESADSQEGVLGQPLTCWAGPGTAFYLQPLGLLEHLECCGLSRSASSSSSPCVWEEREADLCRMSVARMRPPQPKVALGNPLVF